MLGRQLLNSYILQILRLLELFSRNVCVFKIWSLLFGTENLMGKLNKHSFKF